MTTKKYAGVPAAHAYVLRKNGTPEDVIDEVIDTNVELAKTSRSLAKTNEAITKRNRAGADGKAKKYAPMRAIARTVYADLKANLKKNPSFKVFRKEMLKKRPNKHGEGDFTNAWWDEQKENSNNDVLRGWLKDLNAGKF